MSFYNFITVYLIKRNTMITFNFFQYTSFYIRGEYQGCDTYPEIILFLSLTMHIQCTMYIYHIDDLKLKAQDLVFFVFSGSECMVACLYNICYLWFQPLSQTAHFTPSLNSIYSRMEPYITKFLLNAWLQVFIIYIISGSGQSPLS